MKYICPLITVEDMQRSRDFYERTLNQKIKYDFGVNITFHGDFAIHLRTHYQKLINNREIKSGVNNFELYFEFDNLEEIVNDLKKNNVEFIHEIVEQPWYQKVIRFYDPDKNIIEVGESLEFLSYRLYKNGMKIEEIQKKLLFSEEFIKASIKKYK